MTHAAETMKLIHKVRQRNFLYDLNDEDYKNREKKAEAWRSIASEMGYEGGVYWNTKWKTLRDNYNKYKKTKLKTTAQFNKKYRNWPWAEHMKFLDDFSYTRRYSTMTPSMNQDIQNDGNVASTSQNSTKEEAEIDEESDSKTPLINFKSIVNKPRRYKMKTANKKLSQKRNFDEADLFFLSYAKNFKRLSRKNQALLKVEIATLFTRYELQDENETKTQPAFQNFAIFEPSVSCIYENDENSNE